VKVIWSRNGTGIDYVTFDLCPSCLSLGCMNEIENCKPEIFETIVIKWLPTDNLVTYRE
jgi:hypothetical protein